MIVFTPMLLTLSLAWVRPACGANSAEELRNAADRAIRNLESSDSALTNFFERSAGFAIFPSVRKDRINLPGEYVKGIVYEHGKPVGVALLAERNVGTRDGANPFHEAIFFETTEALENFKRGGFVISADLRAVAATEGAALEARYRRGVAIFVVPRSGLMETIIIGDQKFSYKPLE
jgi:lipid-binding SYLF domain-containing protein